MSAVDLDEAKAFLDVIHSADDAKLQLLLAGAEDEALQFMDRPDFDGPWSDCVSETSPSEPDIPASVTMGILLLLQALYQASPDEIATLRNAAQIKLMPYRLRLGV